MRNDIRKLKIEDYENVISEVVDYLKDYNIVKSIYQIGGVSTPGVSDLDLIIVFDDKAKEFTQIWANYMKQQSENSKYVFTHHPFLVNKKIFENGDFLRIFPVFNLKYIYGNCYDIELSYTNEEFITNYLDANLPFWSSEFNLDSQIDIRQDLLRLHSFIYPLTMIKNISNFENERTIVFIKNIKDLREDIFELNYDVASTRIILLRKEASELSSIINREMNTYLQNKLDKYELNFQVKIKDYRYQVTNIKSEENYKYLEDYLFLNVLIYFSEEHNMSKFINPSISFKNYEKDLLTLQKNNFFKSLVNTLNSKIEIYEKYIPWLIKNELGWGGLSSPLFNSFLSFYSTAPENYNKKFKHFLKMKLANLRFYNYARKLYQ